jgi:SagB-type dehydrogenase family enzyme
MEVVEALRGSLRLAGFTTAEVRDPSGQRTGFQILTVEGKQAELARAGFRSSVQVGRYGVNLAAFERLALPELARRDVDLIDMMSLPTGAAMNESKSSSASMLQLPPPERKGTMSLEEALARRRSVREFTPEALSERELSQLLWAAQGITHGEGLRTAPSAGALYPLELYVASAGGFYRYEPRPHRLIRISDRDLRAAMRRTALDQEAITEAPTVFVMVAIYERMSLKYGGARTPRYVHMEVGHAAQNLLLEAVALGLGGVMIGAFEDDALRKALELPVDHRPLYLIPVGHPR